MKKTFIMLLVVSVGFGHFKSYHGAITPYISPGIQIGFNDQNSFFLSCQLTLGFGCKLGNHLEDTLPIFLGKTYGFRKSFIKNKSVEVLKYTDTQLATPIGGIGRGYIYDSDGNSFKRHKYWIGGFGLICNEKIFYKDIIKSQFSIMVVLPFPIEMLGAE